MQEFDKKVVVITGGASGVGRALGERCGRARMQVILSDVEETALAATVADLSATGLDVSGIPADVSDAASMTALAAQVFARHPTVHLLFNNAGIGTDEMQTPLWESSRNDWTWALSVNLWGVIHGIRAFVPTMLARGEEGHVVNTSSGNGGLFPLPTTPIYATTKAAVTCVSEVLHHQLQMARAKLKAGVLFPGPHIVNTRIFESARNRPLDLPMETDPDRPPPTLADIKTMAKQVGVDLAVTEPAEVAEFAFSAIREDRFWLLPPSKDVDARIRGRLESILERRTPEMPSLL